MPSRALPDTMPRRFRPGDAPWVHRLNTAHEVELSPLSLAGLTALVSRATYAAVADPQSGFLLAFDRACVYDSPNFLWFRENLERFVYVDRVAVDANFRGRGIARRLYDDLFDFARAGGQAKVVCEVNAVPPNPGSDAFHAALGFQKIGEATLAGQGKTVRYLCKNLVPGRARG